MQKQSKSYNISTYLKKLVLDHPCLDNHQCLFTNEYTINVNKEKLSNIKDILLFRGRFYFFEPDRTWPGMEGKEPAR